MFEEMSSSLMPGPSAHLTRVKRADGPGFRGEMSYKLTFLYVLMMPYIILVKEKLTVLITTNHNGTGWCYFKQSWH